MNIKEQTKTFLETFKAQREAGLLVLSNTRDFITIEEVLLANKFTETRDWKTDLKQLGQNKSIFIYVNGEFTKEYYDLLKQYSERGSMIQIMNTENMNYETVNFDSFQTKLIFLMTKEALGWAEEKFTIRDKFGLMETIA